MQNKRFRLLLQPSAPTFFFPNRPTYYRPNRQPPPPAASGAPAPASPPCAPLNPPSRRAATNLGHPSNPGSNQFFSVNLYHPQTPRIDNGVICHSKIDTGVACHPKTDPEGFFDKPAAVSSSENRPNQI